MCKARFTEHQIITVLKSVEAGRTVKDVCREAEYLRLRSITGKRSMVAWKPLISKDEGS